MSGKSMATPGDPERRIARALDRIEQAAATAAVRQDRLRQAMGETLADIDRLIAQASVNG